jgi:hypothetical protein
MKIITRIMTFSLLLAVSLVTVQHLSAQSEGGTYRSQTGVIKPYTDSPGH